jgi:hypothetical protein
LYAPGQQLRLSPTMSEPEEASDVRFQLYDASLSNSAA